MEKIKTYTGSIKWNTYLLVPALIIIVTINVLYAQQTEEVGISPWGPDDEIGVLNRMTIPSQFAVLSKISSGVIYDLSVEYFVGMPSFHSLGDPPYQYWLTHTPHGTVVDNPNGLGTVMNEKVSYTGDAISMYTHMGTHIDALNHFGLNGKIWNQFTPEAHLGDKGWKKTGAETIPPIIARGVLIDVAKYKGVDALTDNYRVNASDLQGALKKQGVTLEKGDVVLIRTGQGQFYQEADKYLHQFPGINLDAVKWLVQAIEQTVDHRQRRPTGGRRNRIAIERILANIEIERGQVHGQEIEQGGEDALEIEGLICVAHQFVETGQFRQHQVLQFRHVRL